MYCFLDGYSGYNQIEIQEHDQEKTSFTCLVGTVYLKEYHMQYAMHWPLFKYVLPLLFGFSGRLFRDYFLFFGSSFHLCLTNLVKVLQICVENKLVIS